MASQSSELPKLPLQLPLRDALSIYSRRLGIFTATIIGNLLVVSSLLLLAQVQVVPIIQENQTAILVPDALAIPVYTSVYFADEFEENLSDRWVVLEGSPAVRDGKLFSESGLLVLQLAGIPPAEYSAEFSIGGFYTDAAFIALEVAPALRYSVTYNTGGTIAAWQFFQADTWANIKQEPQIERAALLQVVATADFFAAMSDGSLRSAVNYPRLTPESPFVFSLSEGLLVDFVRLIVP